MLCRMQRGIFDGIDVLLQGAIAGIERIDLQGDAVRRVAQQLHELGFEAVAPACDFLCTACGFLCVFLGCACCVLMQYGCLSARRGGVGYGFDAAATFAKAPDTPSSAATAVAPDSPSLSCDQPARETRRVWWAFAGFLHSGQRFRLGVTAAVFSDSL